MLGWIRRRLAESDTMKTFWIPYSTALSQVLVVVAYLLPWDRTYTLGEGLLEWMYSRLTHDPPRFMVFFIAALVACFVAAIASTLLTMVICTKKVADVSLLRSSSMLSSVALAAPLLYIHRFLPVSGSGLAELTDAAIRDVDIGWFIALLCGSAASHLSLYLYHDARRCIESDCRSKESGHNRLTTLLSVIVPVFMVTSVVGLFLPWSSVSAGSLWVHTSWSVSGFEVSLLMYLVPFAAFLSLVSSLGEDAGATMKWRVPSQAGDNLVAMTFALTLSWGLAFGEGENLVPDLFVNKDLQFGWYLSTISLLILLACALLAGRYGPGTMKYLPCASTRQHS